MVLEKLIKYNDVKDITAEEYFDGNKLAVDVFNAKYAFIKKNGEVETPAEVFWRVSSGLAAIETDKKKEEYYRDRWFTLLWEGWFRPGGSVLSGVGNPKKVSLINCTHIPLKDDSISGIIEKCEYELARCAAKRQGIGVDMTVLRPRGSAINNAAEESDGVVSWATKYSEIGRFVGQKGRMPALLISLDVSHPDIFEFITSKTNLDTIVNANISVQIGNDFINAVKNNKDWELRFDFKDENRESIVKVVKAAELFDLIAKTAAKTAEPGVQYIDLMREGSMVHQVYEATGDERFKIVGTNACSEKPLAGYSVCNLSSINMAKFSTDPDEYRREMDVVIPLITRMADNVVDYEIVNNKYPLPQQKEMLEFNRELGMGITNMHGWFLNQDLAYDDEKSIEVAEKFFSYYAYKVFETSIEIGKEKGNARAWDLVDDKTIFMKSVYFNNIINKFYGGDVSKVSDMRNLAHMSIAPTGSLSLVFPEPVLSTGVEPTFAACYWKKTRAVQKGKYTSYFQLPDVIHEYVLSKLDKNSEEYNILSEFPGSVEDSNGEIGDKIKAIIDHTLPEGFFKAAHEIDPHKKIALMGALYRWVDAAVSCTYNLPEGTDANIVKKLYLEAFDNGIRAMSVYVDGTREGILLTENPRKYAKKFEKKKQKCADNERPLGIIPNCAPKRPKDLPCDIHFTSIQGNMWVVLVGLLDEKPYEIFAGEMEDLYLPKSCKNGIIKKQGNGKYSLEVTIRRSPVVYKDIANILMNDDQKAMTRLLSLSMRHGVRPRYIVDQLRKSNGAITAFSTAVARILSKYTGTYDLKDGDNKCPICGENSLMFVEGCIKCVAEGCNYSRCG